MTILWRVRAILYRLQDLAHPIDDDCVDLIKEVLIKNMTKVVKIAEEDDAPSYQIATTVDGKSLMKRGACRGYDKTNQMQNLRWGPGYVGV